MSLTENIHLSINAETLFQVGDFSITNSMLTSLLVSTLLIGLAIWINRNLKKEGKPNHVQNFAEWILEALLNLVNSVTGDSKKSRHFFPFIASFFLFILLNNWFGLLPGVGTIGFRHQPLAETEVASETENETSFITEEIEASATAVDEHHASFVPLFRPGTADLNTTFALAIISVIATQAFGFRFSGLAYLKKYFNFSNPIMFYVGILELISEFAKLISFAFRLFGNIFAGEVLLVVISALTMIIIPVPFYGLEVFVGLIQALVFAMLTLVFFKAATEHH